MNTIQERLFELQDVTYQEFHSRLMPTISPEVIIGVRTPMIRKLAKELADSAEAEAFLQTLPHTYYEENNLHACLIEAIKDYENCVKELEKFLPYVDNWATCDMMTPKILKKHPEKLLVRIQDFLAAEHTYTIRFGIRLLMAFYLDEEFSPEYPAMVAAVRSEEYYVRMMIAWYFATALAKQYDAVLPYLTGHRLDVWTHNKTIQKAVESYRITKEQKEELRALKRK